MVEVVRVVLLVCGSRVISVTSMRFPCYFCVDINIYILQRWETLWSLMTSIKSRRDLG